MNLLEVEDIFPNGFHDARLYRIDADWCKGVVRIYMGVDDSDISSRDPSYKDVTLCVSGLGFIRMDGPEDHKLETAPLDYLDVVGDPKLASAVVGRRNKWVYRLFVHDWNSFITIAAEHVEVEGI